MEISDTKPAGVALPSTQALPSEWPTSDMYFAAFLQARGKQMLRFNSVPMAGKTRVTFVFAFDPEIESLKYQYHAGSADVKAFDFVTKIKALKSIVHN